MKDFIRTVVDTIKDDRFSWRFKLCNIITNDRLRWETACTRIQAFDMKQDADITLSINNDNRVAKYMKRKSEKIILCTDNIFHI